MIIEDTEEKNNDICVRAVTAQITHAITHGGKFLSHEFAVL